MTAIFGLPTLKTMLARSKICQANLCARLTCLGKEKTPFVFVSLSAKYYFPNDVFSVFPLYHSWRHIALQKHEI